jgi:hypothetical protein
VAHSPSVHTVAFSWRHQRYAGVHRACRSMVCRVPL